MKNQFILKYNREQTNEWSPKLDVVCFNKANTVMHIVEK